jgi:N-acylethanolamine-hydrolysing acid amidase
MIPIYNETLQKTVLLLEKFIPARLEPIVESIALDLLPYLGEFGDEIVAFSKVSGISLGKSIALNLVYEIEASCTSIVAQDANGRIWHGRDLDFNLAKVLRGLVIDVQFLRKGQIHFQATSVRHSTFASWITFCLIRGRL